MSSTGKSKKIRKARENITVRLDEPVHEMVDEITNVVSSTKGQRADVVRTLVASVLLQAVADGISPAECFSQHADRAFRLLKNIATGGASAAVLKSGEAPKETRKARADRKK